MGMFDWVKYKAPCWKCGKELSDFQTKSKGRSMENLNPKEIGLGNFYTMCPNPNCRAWNEYDVVPKEVEIIFNEKESKIKSN